MLYWHYQFFLLPVFSASSNFGSLNFSNLFKHVAIIIIGILIMYATHLVDYKYFKGLSKIILPFVILLLAFTAFEMRLKVLIQIDVKISFCRSFLTIILASIFSFNLCINVPIKKSRN